MSLLLILFIAVGLSSVTSRHVNFYRKDYTYVDEFDAYYKVHWDLNGSSWSSAFLTCDDEGAELFYPKMRDEWTVVKKLVKAMPFAPNVSNIFVGIHDKFGVGELITIDGYPASGPITNLEATMFPESERCVTLDIETGLMEVDECVTELENIRPFVCKKVEDVSCPTIDKGYQYSVETRKCYKLNNKAMSWSKAMETCLMEGGVLLVVESEFEADIIRKKVNFPSDAYFFVGFKKLFNQDYFTVKGHKLRDSGFDNWSSHNENDCGTIWESSNQLYLNSDGCQNIHPFICEMKISE